MAGAKGSVVGGEIAEGAAGGEGWDGMFESAIAAAKAAASEASAEEE